MDLRTRRRALMARKDGLPPIPSLPSGYYRFDWIQCPDSSSANTNTTKMINTGISGSYTTSRYKITAITMPMKLNSTSTSGAWGLRNGTGSSNVPTARVQFYKQGTSPNCLTGGQYNGVDFGSSYSVPLNQKCVFETVGTEFWLNGVKKRDNLSGTYNPVTGQNIWLFGERRASSSYALIGIERFYHFSVLDTQENAWVAYLVPAMKVSDGTMGMYDLVNNSFKTPSSQTGITVGIDNADGFPVVPTYSAVATGLEIDTTARISQGSCYANGKIYSMGVDADNTVQKLYAYDLTLGTLTECGSYTSLSHANSLAYNPTENVLYVATMDASVGIAKIDLTDYSIKSTHVVYNENGYAVTPYGIAYDRTNGVLYSKTGWTGVYVYNTNMEYVRTIAFKKAITAHITGQGLETDGQYLYSLFSSPKNQVDIYTLSGERVAQETLGFSAEAEEIAYDWNQGFYVTTYTASNKLGIYSASLRDFS